MNTTVNKLVQMSLAFHNLNKSAETRLGLSLIQYQVLITLKDMPGCSPQELAKTAGMHPSTLTQTLKRLEKKDAIYISKHPVDSRKKSLSLTRSGFDLLNKFSVGIEVLLRDHKLTAKFDVL